MSEIIFWIPAFAGMTIKGGNDEQFIRFYFEPFSFVKVVYCSEGVSRL